MLQAQRIACNDYYQYQKNRHHIPGHLLNSALHTIVYDKCSHSGEQQGKNHWGYGRGDEGGKVAILCSGICLSCQVDHSVFGDPTADDRVVGHNQNWYKKS